LCLIFFFLKIIGVFILNKNMSVIFPNPVIDYLLYRDQCYYDGQIENAMFWISFRIPFP